jgi:membrane dipeptidase
MLIDLSHVSVGTMHAALNVSVSPVVFTHSNAKTLCGSDRNVPDDVLLRLAENGGVVMVNHYTAFVSCQSAATLEQVADHYDYIIKGTCPSWATNCVEGYVCIYLF